MDQHTTARRSASGRSESTGRPVLVTLHAHPDDEAIFTGGTILKAVEAGWRVVLVVATEGDRGECPDDGVTDLATRRRAETMRAAALLGVERVEFLGYGDSGHEAEVRPGDSGTTSGVPTLAASDVEVAARTVRSILDEEQAVALTSYDAHGIYGHADHVQIHRIAARAVEGTCCELYEATLRRSGLRRLRHHLVGRGLDTGRWPQALNDRLGLEDGIDLVGVDVTRHLPTKLAAVAAHSSQVLEAPSFMGLPAGAFHHLFGTEWFRVARPGDERLLDMVRSSGRLGQETPGRQLAGVS